MFIQFDKKSLHLQVICGILEKFEPTKEIEDLQQKLAELKQLVQEFQDTTVGPKLQEIDSLVNSLNSKQTKKE